MVKDGAQSLSNPHGELPGDKSAGTEEVTAFQREGSNGGSQATTRPNLEEGELFDLTARRLITTGGNNFTSGANFIWRPNFQGGIGMSE